MRAETNENFAFSPFTFQFAARLARRGRPRSQKYKEGRYIVEKAKLIDGAGF